MVYFLQSPKGGPIKIGHSIQVYHRLKTHCRNGGGEFLNLLLLIEGGEARERELHEQFKHLRLPIVSHGVGEWFTPGPDLFHWILGSKIKELSELAWNYEMTARNDPACRRVFPRLGYLIGVLRSISGAIQSEAEHELEEYCFAWVAGEPLKTEAILDLTDGAM